MEFFWFEPDEQGNKNKRLDETGTQNELVDLQTNNYWSANYNWRTF